MIHYNSLLNVSVVFSDSVLCWNKVKGTPLVMTSKKVLSDCASGSSLEEKISSGGSADVLISGLKVSPVVAVEFQFWFEKIVLLF